jgi:hypothetical protein
MKMKVNLIMSAELRARTPAQDRENVARTNELHRQLNARGITFVPALGSYKGVEERSVCALVYDSDDYDWLLQLAARYGQESVLVVDLNRVARLVYMAGGVERIGMMERVPEHVARERDGWTRTRASTAPDSGFVWWAVNRDGTPGGAETYHLAEAQRLDVPSVWH